MSGPDLTTIRLLSGKHARREEGVCALELVAWLAGEEHSDHPACVSPVVAHFVRAWNDHLSDADRFSRSWSAPRRP